MNKQYSEVFMIHIKLIFDQSMKKNTHPDMFDALKREVKRKLTSFYPELEISTLWGSQTKLIVDGLKANEKKDKITDALEEIWSDMSWMPEVEQSNVDEFEYLD